ncbi:hypothetical protein EVAR_46713_1 [Eumeta japonica]|uniref:Uncharacterized protein n=1 Tax=Eumeta variegata TaxID=151549 RepID=A0A4C1XE88_EUMVA|nr:hypothetical protein EVAR_46713_1 [Eumeta japonica]
MKYCVGFAHKSRPREALCRPRGNEGGACVAPRGAAAGTSHFHPAPLTTVSIVQPLINYISLFGAQCAGGNRCAAATMLSFMLRSCKNVAGLGTVKVSRGEAAVGGPGRAACAKCQWHVNEVPLERAHTRTLLYLRRMV